MRLPLLWTIVILFSLIVTRSWGTLFVPLALLSFLFLRYPKYTHWFVLLSIVVDSVLLLPLGSCMLGIGIARVLQSLSIPAWVKYEGGFLFSVGIMSVVVRMATTHPFGDLRAYAITAMVMILLVGLVRRHRVTQIWEDDDS